MDKESKSLNRGDGKQQSTRNESTPLKEESPKQRRDDWDRSIKMRESSITSPKPEIVEQINGNEVDLSDPYK